jgi:O-antigen ligase
MTAHAHADLPPSAKVDGTDTSGTPFGGLAVFFLLGVGLLNQTYPTPLAAFGFCALLLMLGLLGITLLAGQLPTPLVGIWLPLVAVYCVSLLLAPTLGALKCFFQLVSCALLFLWGWRIRDSDSLLTGLGILRTVMLAFAAIGLACYFPFPDDLIFTNPNISGGVASCSLFLDAMMGAIRPDPRKRSRRILSLLPAIVLLLLSGARASWLQALAFAWVFFSWKWLTRGRRRFWTVLVGIALVIWGLVFALAKIGPSLELYETLQEESQQYTGKNIGTRTAIWASVIPDIQSHPWTGWGLARQAGDALEGDPDFSCHNQYLELGIKTGFTGIAALALAIALLWSIFWRGRERPEVRVGAAMVIGILVHQTFEVDLLQNGLAIGLIWWILLGVAAGKAIEVPAAAPASAPAEI